MRVRSSPGRHNSFNSFFFHGHCVLIFIDQQDAKNASCSPHQTRLEIKQRIRFKLKKYILQCFLEI